MVEKQLNFYIDKIKLPFERPFRYNFNPKCEITFDENFKLESINTKDILYSFQLNVTRSIYELKK